MTVNVLDDDDRVVDQHTDGEGDPCQRDDVEVASEQVKEDEGPDDADRDRRGDDDGGAQAAQKHQQHADRQQATEEDVLLDLVDGAVDIETLIVNPL